MSGVLVNPNTSSQVEWTNFSKGNLDICCIGGNIKILHELFKAEKSKNGCKCFNFSYSPRDQVYSRTLSCERLRKFVQSMI